jgi:hemin uptake protein HemP
MGTIRVAAGDLSADEIIERLRSGERVLLETEFLGGEHEVTLRHDGETFYCDTPTTLHRHETESGMRDCLRDQGYAADRGEPATG